MDLISRYALYIWTYFLFTRKTSNSLNIFNVILK